MSTPIFITGTDTDVGKTFVSALLVKKWRCNYWKPIQTGLDSDPGDTATVEKLLAQSGGAPKESEILPPALEFKKPLSPWRCTVLENRQAIDVNSMKLPAFTNQSKYTIVEGAGGVFVPLTETKFTPSLIKHFNAKAIVVARSELGTLNHTLLTLEALKAQHVEVIGVILNGEINEDNCTALKELGVSIIAQVPLAKSLNDVMDCIPDISELL